MAVPGFAGYGVRAETSAGVQRLRPEGTPASPVFEPTPYVNNTIKMFEQLRARLGFDVELLHDINERVPPNQAVQLCKAVEPYRPFFMEDPLRQQTACAIAMASCSSIATNGFSWPPSG
jgi:mannonate dehydratase